MRCPVGGPGGVAPWSKTNVGFFHKLKLPLLGAIFICFHYFNRQKLTFLLPLRRFNHFYQRVQKNNLVVTSHMWHTAHIFSRKKFGVLPSKCTVSVELKESTGSKQDFIFFRFFLWLKNIVAILPSVQLEIFIVFDREKLSDVMCGCLSRQWWIAELY